MWNHGAEFGFWDQTLDWSDFTETRGLLIDDNCKENGITSAISIFELEEGLKRSGVKLDLVYWDVCLMNMIENIYQIKDYTNFVMGSAHPTPDNGGHYTLLMDALERHTDIPSAMKEFIPANVMLWKDLYEDNSSDLALIDMSKIDATVALFKDISDSLISLKCKLKEEVGSQNELRFDYYLNESSYLFDKGDSEGSIDMQHFVRVLGNSLVNGGLSAKAAMFSKAIDDMILVRAGSCLPTKMSNYSLGLCLRTKKQYKQKYKGVEGYKTCEGLSVTYPLLHFAQATGWHNFLQINDWRRVEYNDDTELFEEGEE